MCHNVLRRGYGSRMTARDLAVEIEAVLPQDERVSDPDPMADKVNELRSYIVSLIADAISARAGTPGHHAEASDLLAGYLTYHHLWSEVERSSKPPCPMHGCDGSAHDHGNSAPSQQVSGNNGGVS